ncbi:hypothetical protein JMJ35_001785 [Cladonia borealis]|uniref:Cytochrome b-c1 complex subunit 8 n=1 Tax=Cladonia borealis TaxID=184061 RepID=A0AA39R949_9LECA|nr:hypothetical protein JMJ35_001785 [Cladonia borealis]
MTGGSEPLDTRHGQYLGPWGNLGSQPQKGIITYAISANRQRPLAGTMHTAVFNTWRRSRAQLLFVVPPFAVAYLAVDWAVKKNEYYNSKPGRMAEAAEAEGADMNSGPVRG